MAFIRKCDRGVGLVAAILSLSCTVYRAQPVSAAESEPLRLVELRFESGRPLEVRSPSRGTDTLPYVEAVRGTVVNRRGDTLDLARLKVRGRHGMGLTIPRDATVELTLRSASAASRLVRDARATENRRVLIGAAMAAVAYRMIVWIAPKRS